MSIEPTQVLRTTPPCVVLAIGAREHQEGAGWGGYSVDEAARRHGAGVERETNDPREAYAAFPDREPTSAPVDSLPDD